MNGKQISQIFILIFIIRVTLAYQITFNIDLLFGARLTKTERNIKYF